MKVLVTGGAGFVGGHISESFVEEGYDVVAFDSLNPYYDLGIKKHNVEAAREASQDEEAGSYELVEGDVRDEELVDELVADADYVYHQAAQAGVRTSVEEPRKVNSINVGGTLNILESARKHDVERFVLASSSSVYGKPEYLPYDEEHPRNPVSPYGVSKVAGEEYARVYNKLHSLPVVSLRYFTVYGPRMRPNMAFTNFVSRCLHGKPPVVYGDGKQTRDFTYVDDAVEANLKLLGTDVADGEVMNIGSTDNISIIELARTVRDLIDPSLEIEFDERHEADAEHTHANVSKANEVVGYEPTTDIEEGAEKFVKWYRENEDWYDPMVRRS